MSEKENLISTIKDTFETIDNIATKTQDVLNMANGIVGKATETIENVTNHFTHSDNQSSPDTTDVTISPSTEISLEVNNGDINENSNISTYENQTSENKSNIPDINQEKGLTSAIAEQVSTNSVVAETMAARPDLAIITGFQEICRVLNNPNFKEMYITKLNTQLDSLKTMTEFESNITTETNRHEEFMITQQRAILEKMIDASLHKFDSKMEFLRMQQQQLTELYQKDLSLITEHIQVLEAERSKNMDNTKIYFRLGDEISKLEDSKLLLKKDYRISSSQLTDAIKTIEIEMKYDNTIGINNSNSQINKLLDNKF